MSTQQKEIIEMARQIATQASKVGPYRTWTHEYAMSLIMQLVDVSAAKEREACAKLVEDSWMAFSRASNIRLDITPFPELSYVAKVIRARGET